MKRSLISIAVMVMFIWVATVPATTTQTDPEFTAFLTRFRAAIARNDKEAVASMTKLPFLYDSKERSRAEFIKIYPQLFTPRIRRCLVRAKPLKEGENYDLFCGQLIFYLGKDGGEYKLLEFGVND